jgi:hypothetical protein
MGRPFDATMVKTGHILLSCSLQPIALDDWGGSEALFAVSVQDISWEDNR